MNTPDKPKVSILVLTHNAARYVRTTLKSLRTTTGVDYEVIVVDNDSRFWVRVLLLRFYRKGWIDKLWFLNYNSLFAAGNNVASSFADPAATHFLLLNSDVEIRRSDWLQVLLENHERGITSYGVVTGKPVTRVDGYCLLIDRDLYEKHRLDESFEWFWSITKLQATVLGEGHSVKGFSEHERLLHHFGGKSGKAFRGAKGMRVDRGEVVSWFQEHTIRLLTTPRGYEKA